MLVLVKSKSLYLCALHRIGIGLSNMFVSLHELREWVVQLFVNCKSTHFFPYFLLVSPIISVDMYLCVYCYTKHCSGGNNISLYIYIYVCTAIQKIVVGAIISVDIYICIIYIFIYLYIYIFIYIYVCIAILNIVVGTIISVYIYIFMYVLLY